MRAGYQRHDLREPDTPARLAPTTIRATSDTARVRKGRLRVKRDLERERGREGRTAFVPTPQATGSPNYPPRDLPFLTLCSSFRHGVHGAAGGRTSGREVSWISEGPRTVSGRGKDCPRHPSTWPPKWDMCNSISIPMRSDRLTDNLVCAGDVAEPLAPSCPYVGVQGM